MGLGLPGRAVEIVRRLALVRAARRLSAFLCLYLFNHRAFWRGLVCRRLVELPGWRNMLGGPFLRRGRPGRARLRRRCQDRSAWRHARSARSRGRVLRIRQFRRFAFLLLAGRSPVEGGGQGLVGLRYCSPGAARGPAAAALIRSRCSAAEIALSLAAALGKWIFGHGFCSTELLKVPV